MEPRLMRVTCILQTMFVFQYRFCMYSVLLDAALPLFLWHVAGWVPTRNIHFKSAFTKSSRVSFRFRPHHCGGYLEEDGEIWDMSTGKLLAISRQMAMVGVSQRRGLGRRYDDVMMVVSSKLLHIFISFFNFLLDKLPGFITKRSCYCCHYFNIFYYDDL